MFKKFKRNIFLYAKRLNVSQIIIGAFLLIVLIGTLLLLCPFSSRNGRSCGFMTALFTATSATCVTGLSLGDTYFQWSAFGKVVILIMIQLGGLGFMSVAAFFLFALRQRIDLKSMLLMAQSMGTENMEDVIRIQKKILKGGLIIELLGALILAFRLKKYYTFPYALWLGIFHSVSAFCNAGFDIFGFIEPGGSLIPFQEDPVFLLTISVLIIVGGIGFVVWDDLTSGKNPKRWSVYTKLVLVVTFILVAGGTLVFLFLEFNNSKTIGHMPFELKLLNAFFQSVTTRTAGFAAIDQGALTETGKLFSIFLMFIGGASGSTAGGLKVATFAIFVLFLFTRMRGKNDVNILGRRVPENLIMSALSLFGMMTLLSFFGSIIICGTTDFGFIDSFYETVSALATVGLSTGVLSGVGLVSKILLVIYMFFGRLGILTISMGFFQNTKKADVIKYPEINMPIG